MLVKPDKYLQMQREFQVSQLARQCRLQNVLGFRQAYLGYNHVAFEYKLYQYDLREYLRIKRDHRQLPSIFTQIAKGIEELHRWGIIHRDLKPDNVVVSLRPLKVKIIDFDRSVNLAVGTKGTFVGTEGYYPFKPQLDDGSTKWDIWALGAMILEADLEVDVYRRVDNERMAQNLCEQHLKRNDVSQELKEVLKMTVMAAQAVDIEKLEVIMPLIPRMRFLQHKDTTGRMIRDAL
jgi:serine/threonine protein kinase